MNRIGPATNRIAWKLAASFALLALTGGVGCATGGNDWQAGLEAYEDGRHEDAEAIWQEALAASEAYGEDDPRLAQSLRTLGGLYIQTGHYAEARTALERWLEIEERGGDVGSLAFADGAEALAGVYVVDGEFDRAVALYERAGAIRQQHEPES